MWEILIELAAEVIGEWATTRKPSSELGPEPKLSPAREPPVSAAEVSARARVGEAICTVLMAVARADGKVDEVELVPIRDALAKRTRLTRPLRNAFVEGLRAAAGSSVDLNIAAARVRGSLNQAEVLLVLDAVYAVAKADGKVLRPEMAAIREIATLLEIDPVAQRSALARNLGATALCYDILGIAPSASNTELHDAYLRLTMLTNPSELSRLGPDASKTTRARHDQIELAYQEICQMRGLPVREEPG